MMKKEPNEFVLDGFGFVSNLELRISDFDSEREKR
jgi:hypothetical protein